MTFVLATVAPSVSSAAEIALTLENQGVTIAGDYQGFRGNAYIVKTSGGIIHVPAMLASCAGSDCLNITISQTTDG